MLEKSLNSLFRVMDRSADNHYNEVREKLSHPLLTTHPIHQEESCATSFVLR